MFKNVFGSDGKFHLENQVGNIRYDLTTGESKTVYPVGSNTNMTFDNSGVHTEFRRAICVIDSASRASTGFCSPRLFAGAAMRTM